MNSSTSSFKTELKVFLVVALVVGLADICQRVYYHQGHAEAKLLFGFPAQADTLADAHARGDTTMILLGNSLTQNGYDMPLLKERLDAGGHANVHVEKVALSGSNPIEWYHNFNNSFVRRGKAPTAIVINMSPSGISDELPAGYRIGWLANETRWSDVPEVLFDDLKDFEVGGQYLQARVSMLYATRWDQRVGILQDLMPNVPAGMNWVNSAQLAAKTKAKQAAPNAPTPVPPPKTYSLLNRLLTLAQTSGTHVILVEMPAREPYTIDPDLPGILAPHDVRVIDARRDLSGLTKECFEDGWHLNPAGTKIFTAYMAEELPAVARAFRTPVH